MKVLVAGDFAPRNRIITMLENKDFSFFSEVLEVTKKCDYSIINFESPIVNEYAEPIIKTGPNIKCHSHAMQAVKFAGFDCVTLANNHFYDYGDVGVRNTLEECFNNSIDYVGGGKDIKEAEKILYKSLNNRTLAIINVCENEWSIATEYSGGSAPLNLVSNVRMIRDAKNHADYVLMIIHGGTEHYQLPSPRMRNLYRFFIEEGVDVVVNHHQHCYSGFEVYRGRPIFYGLGNFCFDRNSPEDKLWNEGYAVEISFDNKDISYRILPYIQCAEDPKVCFSIKPDDFQLKINELNRIIKDEHALLDSFAEMASRKSFLHFLEPYNNKYLKFLRTKGFLPSFLSWGRKDMILEIFRCESHRDIMFELLKRK